MGTHQLIVGLREDQVANLTASVDAVKLAQADGVPQTDALVSGAAASCQQTSVQRAPVDSFHCSLVIRELLERFVA
jgi:hypothetical protein